MTRPENNHDGESSPLSTPLGSPEEFESKHGNLVPKRETTESASGQASSDSGSSKMKLSIDTTTSPSEYDHMARSQLYEPERPLASSGLRRIRQQPSPRLGSIAGSASSSFIAPPLSRSSTTPQSGASSRAASTSIPPEPTSPALEDLHRFPSESLHSFSFAKQSEELLQNRQNILKRSIDFMRDRFSRTTSNPGIANVQAHISGDTEVQSMMDLLARASIMGKEGGQGQGAILSPRGPLTGPAEVNGDNIFEKSFSDQTRQSKSNQNSTADYDGSADPGRFLSPIVDEPVSYQRRDLKSAPSSRRASLKRTFTDLSSASLHGRLGEGASQQYNIPDSVACQLLSPNGMSTMNGGPSVHSHSSKWSPVSQAVFRTESESPWTIFAANDLACLVFGVTQAEVRNSSILEVVQKDRREWLESKLRVPDPAPMKSYSQPEVTRSPATNTRSMMTGTGVTAQLLNKPPSRKRLIRRAQTEDGYGSSYGRSKHAKKSNHPSTKSRGVLLCGDVVPIQKRNGTTGSASFWVMEKRGGLIWVIEEITEDVAYLRFDGSGCLKEAQGDIEDIWGPETVKKGSSITHLLPQIPADLAKNDKDSVFSKIAEMKYFTARASNGMKIPITVTQVSGPRDLRVSCFPHVAGMMVLSSSTLNIISANSVFSSALFGEERPEGSHVTDLIPGFDEFLNILTEEDNMPLVDGIVIPEQSFRRAKAISALRDETVDAASVLMQPTGLPAKHRDGSHVTVDVQMRIVKSETFFTDCSENPLREEDETESGDGESVAVTEVVYALWITYSRQLHSTTRPDPQSSNGKPLSTSGTSLPQSPPEQPSSHTDSVATGPTENKPQQSLLTEQLNKNSQEPLVDKPVQPATKSMPAPKREEIIRGNKTIDEYLILEEMGQGAYGQVKLARCKKNTNRKVVLKYVTKRRILVDTWTRDRRLGTVPLEIHVLDYLRRDELWHPNIVEMDGFFEDDVNYYIEMVPHGLPGMDLFDYIELRTNMDEGECRNIFQQVVDAVHHLHTKALVVHRDIKDENVILNGEGKIKLIDFGSASYIKNGPFDVFVGTIDYAAPEVLQGKSYRGKEQDVWALGILLYTIVYKENPFYNIDEILDHPLRVPFIPFSEDCIDLIRRMLDRDVDERLTITEVMEHPWMTAT